MMIHVYRVAYTIRGDSKPDIYLANVAGRSKAEAKRRVDSAIDPHDREQKPTDVHVARWIGRHENCRRGTFPASEIDIDHPKAHG